MVIDLKRSVAISISDDLVSFIEWRVSTALKDTLFLYCDCVERKKNRKVKVNHLDLCNSWCQCQPSQGQPFKEDLLRQIKKSNEELFLPHLEIVTTSLHSPSCHILTLLRSASGQSLPPHCINLELENFLFGDKKVPGAVTKNSFWNNNTRFTWRWQ